MDKDLGKIKKNDDTQIVVRIDDFGGKRGLTIREFVTSDRYNGFTKSGTRIPAEYFNEFKTMINSVKPEDLKSSEESVQKKLPKTSDDGDNSGIDDEGLM